MNTRTDIRIPLIAVFEIALLLMLGILNDMLSQFSVYIFVPAVLLVAPCMFLNFTSAVAVAFCAGYMFEAFLPVRDGIAAFGLLAGALAGLWFAPRLRVLGKPSVSLVFTAMNALMFLLCAAVMPSGSADWISHGERLFFDFLFSSAFTAAAAPFAVSVCEGMFMLCGIDLDYYGRV